MKPDLEKIKQLLRQRGMTQAKFAEQMGLKKQTLSNLLNGQAKFPDSRLRQIAELLGVDVADLYKTELATVEVPEGETLIQCPCCKELIAISLKCSKVKDPDDPFAPSHECKI